MKDKLFVICDSDEAYLSGLQNYLERKKLVDFQIKGFHSIEQLKAFCSSKTIEILLVNEAFCEEIDEALQVRKLFVLQEDKAGESKEYKENTCFFLYKYQSVERMLSSVLDSYARDGESSCKLHRDSKETRLITFYSPDGQSNQTLAALAAGQVLSEQKKVLYLNLLPFSGLEGVFQTEFTTDLSDFIYFAMKHSERLLYKLEAMKKNVSGMDYIPSIRNPKDLLQIDEQQWERILEALLYVGEYQEVIIEVTDACRGLDKILDRSDRIFTVHGESELAMSRLAEYKAFCVNAGRTDILEKTSFIPEPLLWREQSYDYEELLLGHPGQYMKGILMKDGIM